MINPNNPNRVYLNKDDLEFLMSELSDTENRIVDPFFIYFAHESLELSQLSLEELINKYRNLTINKSMSKNFGIAGIRADYTVIFEYKVKQLLLNGYLWNVSDRSSYFFRMSSDKDFLVKVEVMRKNM